MDYPGRPDVIKRVRVTGSQKGQIIGENDVKMKQR